MSRYEMGRWETADGPVYYDIHPEEVVFTGENGKQFLISRTVRTQGKLGEKLSHEYLGKPRVSFVGLDSNEVFALLAVLHRRSDDEGRKWISYLSERMKS